MPTMAEMIGLCGALEGEIAHESLVHLQAGDGELLQIAEGSVARAEVVDGHAHAGVAQASHAADRRVDLADHEVLGDLDLQRLRLDPVALERGEHALHHVTLLEVPRR